MVKLTVRYLRSKSLWIKFAFRSEFLGNFIKNRDIIRYVALSLFKKNNTSWLFFILQPNNVWAAHNYGDLDPFKFRWLIPLSALQVRLGNTAGNYILVFFNIPCSIHCFLTSCEQRDISNCGTHCRISCIYLYIFLYPPPHPVVACACKGYRFYTLIDVFHQIFCLPT